MDAAFVHYEFYARPGDLIEIRLDRPGAVRLLTRTNYRAFLDGQPCHAEILAETTLFRISLPWEDDWHVVIEPTGGAPVPRCTARLVRG